MNLLYDTLVDLGFTVVRPGGTFFIFSQRHLRKMLMSLPEGKGNTIRSWCPSDNFWCAGVFPYGLLH